MPIASQAELRRTHDAWKTIETTEQIIEPQQAWHTSRQNMFLHSQFKVSPLNKRFSLRYAVQHILTVQTSCRSDLYFIALRLDSWSLFSTAN